jgi:hypothetical protein
MTEVLIFSVFVGFWCSGLFIAAQEEMLLHPIASFLEKKLGWWAKPLITCAPCMCGLHGAVIFCLFCITGFFKWDEYFFLIGIPPAIFIASFTTMINKYFVLVNYEREDLINQKHDFYHVNENGGFE